MGQIPSCQELEIELLILVISEILIKYFFFLLNTLSMLLQLPLILWKSLQVLSVMINLFSDYYWCTKQRLLVLLSVSETRECYLCNILTLKQHWCVMKALPWIYLFLSFSKIPSWIERDLLYLTLITKIRRNETESMTLSQIISALVPLNFFTWCF